MTPIQKIAEACEEMLELKSKSTNVVAWYPHSEDGTVRGPFCRWLEVKEVLPEYKQHVALIQDEVKFFAHAANNAAKLASALRICAEGLESIAAFHMTDKEVQACGGDEVVSDTEAARWTLARAAELLSKENS